ncbi:uncharacterized protein FIBRA_09228 [Fibroporia radiculosa]|uniref:Methyltransferase type 11 domain-containing protein n=1 Tax=Fibroporia radiculosa TaxID=599839 RepID=J7SC63_9APHY|nr:uncharacterized protein FIBRA_09228 [Fibroporia radiculosa]CCM06916.1 predicted protein [Fibroporia radiculosa]
MSATESTTAPDTWSAATYNKTAAFVYSQAYTSAVLALLAAQPGEQILDLGCGSGEVTREIAALVGDTGRVVGTDNSQSMIEQCRANGLAHVFVSDAQDLRFPPGWTAGLCGGYDAVFSNAALHWCKRAPAGVLAGARRVLKPGGRLVVEMGGFMNVVGVRAALHRVLSARGYSPAERDPWYFPSTEDYAALLEAAGFEVQHISLNPRVTPLPGPLTDWLRLFARPYFMEGLSDEEAEAVMAEVQEMCRVDCCDSQGKWCIMYTRLRVAAVLPA